MSGPIQVEGGIGGTAVGLQSLEVAALQLASADAELGGTLARVVAVATDPDLLLSAALSPTTAVRVEVTLASVVSPGGLAGRVAELSALASATVLATATYREVEREVTVMADATHDAVMFAVGWCAPEIAVGALALDALGVDLASTADHAVFALPALAELGGGTAGLAAGLTADPLTAPLIRGGGSSWPSHGQGRSTSTDSPNSLGRPGRPGRPDGPDSPRSPGSPGSPGDGYDESLRILADSAAAWGLLDDGGRAWVTMEAAARDGAEAPTSLESLAADTLNVADADAYPGHVRVVEVPGLHGSSWVVQISGTQVWSPRAGDNPLDVTTDVRSMARESTVLAQAVDEALRQAKADSGRDASADPVLLSGHSLGGIAAAGLAASPQFTARHHVTHVVTMGSPVSRVPVPPGIQVMSLEHSQDPVPRLEGRRNPDRQHWVTVTRDLHGDPHGVDTASGAHAAAEYLETAAMVDASQDRSVQGWRAGSGHFFEPRPGSVPVIRDFRIARIPADR